MVLVAVAGGTSPTLGRSIVTAIAQTSNTPVILSRSPDEQSKWGAAIRHVDYDDKQSLQTALRGVHTVISVIKNPGPSWAACQISLLHAAEAAGVKRFAPSEFECGPLADGRVELFALKAGVRDECESARARGMECALFSNSIFMNYLAIGLEPDGSRQDELLEGLVDSPLIWDVARATAELPVKDDGTFPRLTMTSIGDIGRFVAAACLLPDGKWLPVMTIAGETLPTDAITRLLGERTGKRFDMRTVDRKELQHRAASVEGFGETGAEIVMKMTAQLDLLMTEDELPGKLVLEPIVNKLCPQVQPTSVRAFLGLLPPIGGN